MATATATRKRQRKDGEAAVPAPEAGTQAPAKGSRKGPRYLVVVESPTKARTLQGILGSDYEVMASLGHVRDLPTYGYGVENVEQLDFRPKYVVVKDRSSRVDKAEVIKEIAEAAKKAERVFLSTDPDREGEAIAWHIKEAAGIPDEKVTRVVFHEITRPAIEAAFAEATGQAPKADDGHGRREPGKLDMHLVDAQQARRVLDRLIGYPLTWFVQKKVSRGASAGRVQSVALGLIVKREREIQSFVPVEYWTVEAQLAKEGRPFAAGLVSFDGMKKGAKMRPEFGPAGPAIPDEATANRLLEGYRRARFAVTAVKPGQRKVSPAPPFTTSTFQQAAVNRLGMSTARAMAVAQELYEGVNGMPGLITYMRTDSVAVSPVAQQQARAFIRETWGEAFVPEKPRVYRTRARGAQEAHEAIRPTNPALAPEQLRRALSAEQLKVYQLIWQRFLASQMTDAVYRTMTVDIEATAEGAPAGTFRANASTLVFEGHLKAYGAEAAETDEDGEQVVDALPELAAGDVLERRAVEAKRHETQPPPRYTEASLVKALEELGIGRPSTYASIVQTVLKREYVRKEGRQLVPQELGFIVHDLLEQHMKKYVDVPFTGEMEEELDEVASGERDWMEVLREFWPEFKAELDRAEASAEKEQQPTDIPCEGCGQANLVIKWGRNGKFFGCPRYPECTFTLPMGPDGQPVRAGEPVAIPYRCPKDGGRLLKKSGRFGEYVECENRAAGTCDFRGGVPVGVPCPEEPETGQLVEKSSRRGTFYACWNYPNCSYTTNSLEPGKMTPPRPPEVREEANRKLLERSARGKAAFAKRRANAAARKAS
ncbi:MAG: DNA topoisomerase 1 [Tepidiforma sp.]|nr:type I DNA topoisomerase [Tepidiforma sp.]GIW19070.1 MAG: DNA topoisomerase 1 [Tepidiforma sp.]